MKPATSVFLAAFALAACAGPQDSVAHDEREGAHATQKPGAAIAFTHRLRDAVAPGGAGIVETTISELYSDGVIKISAMSQSLDLAEASASTQFSASGRDDHRWDIFFDAPDAPGVYYIDLSAWIVSEDGASMMRAYSIPVQVGDEASTASKPAPTMQRDASGEPVVVMSAEETRE